MALVHIPFLKNMKAQMMKAQMMKTAAAPPGKKNRSRRAAKGIII